MIIGLHRHGRLYDYYNDDINTLEHFRYRDTFLRHTKNVFISIVPSDMIEKITKSATTTYETIRKRLYRRRMPTRINELRDYYGTFMVRHGLIREEVDLLQGRISKSIFVRHYWSPAIKELKQRVFKALKELELNLLS